MSVRDDRNHGAAPGSLGERLRTLPAPPLPDGLLDEIWSATCDRPVPRGLDAAPPRRSHRTARPSRGLAAAAALALTATVVWLGADRVADHAAARAEEAHLAAIEHDLHLAMTRVGRALARAERITVNDALGASTATLRHGALTAPSRADTETRGITP